MQTPHATADPLSVLIVDDHRDCADSLADLLRIYGHGVQTADDASSALAAELPDIVILELRLRSTDGWELVRQMRTRYADKQPLFIALTTCGTEKDRCRSAEAGMDLHLVKPVDPAILIEELNRLTQPHSLSGSKS